MIREPSPYAWTKPKIASEHVPPGDIFLSPDTITPSAASRFTGIPRSTPTSASTAAPTSTPARAPSATPSSHRRLSSTIQRDTVPTRRESPYAQVGASSSEDEQARGKRNNLRRTSANAYSGYERNPETQPSEHGTPMTYRTARQDTGVPSQSSRYDMPERYGKPEPLKVASSHSRRASENRSSQESYEPSSRRTSGRYPPSPPRSPMANVDRPRDCPPTNLPLSRPGSQAGSSTHSSPHPSPRLSKSSMTADALWGSFAATGVAGAAAALHHPKSTSRLSSSSRTASSNTIPRSTPTSYPAQESSASLPYPDEDRMFQSMPSERDHQYIHPEQRGEFQGFSEESKPISRTTTPSASLPIPARRPPLSTRNSGVDDFPSSPSSPRNVRPGSSGYASSRPKTAAQLKALSRILPPCPRPTYTAAYDDWYMLEGSPGFNICPECLESVFGDTYYRSYFKRAASRAYIGKGLEVKCDFANAWIRLGWLLTVQRELPSLDLIKSLVNLSRAIDMDEDCPGSEAEVRNWYSMRDRHGHFLRGFAVCSADVRKLQVLFPGFRDVWQPLPIRSSYSYGDSIGGLRRTCSLRPALNNRFPLYIDTLVRLHEPAYQAGRLPDVSELISLIRRKHVLLECPRDNMVHDGDWHFIPSLLPAFTVCEDCYDEVVLPAVETDSDVAMRFNTSPQPVPGEGRLGSSCQLYSSRMRRLFQQAVKENGLKSLARQSLERKEMEDRLQGRMTEIHRMAERLQSSARRYGMSEQAQAELRLLAREEQELRAQWSEWE